MTRNRRNSERGYALIFVFVLSATMALSLYMELPRLALEMQRNREELLIQRGEQYVRAIKVFSRKNKKYPQTIEELENFNGVRFLRRRYVDPMTGKDEWRLIHADGGGRLTDSLVQKQGVPGQTGDQQKSANNFVSEGPSFGSTGDASGNRAAQALNRRASDMPGAAGAPPLPGESTTQGVPVNGDPLQQQQQQLLAQQQQQQQQQTMVPIVGPNGQPIQRVPGLPGQLGTGSPYPTQPASSQTGGQVAQTAQQIGSGYSFGSGYSGSTSTQTLQGPQPGQPGFQPGAGGFRPGGGSVSLGGGPTPGASPSGIAVNPATSMIQQILTRPNPQGLSNIQGGLGGGQALGGGIVGVASKHDAEGVKIYKERTNYKEWEFVYDQAKEQKAAQGQIPGQNNTQGTGNNSGFGRQQGGSFSGQQGGFGGSMPVTR